MHRLDPTQEPDEDGPSHAGEPISFLAKALHESRTVLLFGEITTELAQATTAKLMALAAKSDEPIRMIIHSQGGHVEAGDTIHDMIRFIRAKVVMIGTGWVASAGALIYAAAQKGNRLALPNTRFLLHQPLGGVRGRASDIEIESRQILAMRERLNRIFADATGQPYPKVAEDTEHNYWMTAEEARAYGLVDRVIRSVDEI